MNRSPEAVAQRVKRKEQRKLEQVNDTAARGVADCASEKNRAAARQSTAAAADADGATASDPRASVRSAAVENRNVRASSAATRTPRTQAAVEAGQGQAQEPVVAATETPAT